MISATEGLLCKYCGKSFEKYYNFKYHIDVVHRGMKPFGCKKCSKKFGRRSDAKRHTEEHCKGPNVEVEEAGELKPDPKWSYSYDLTFAF